MPADLKSLFLLNLLGYGMLYICAVMCYIPMAGKLKISIKKLTAITFPSLTVFSLCGAYISARFEIEQNAVTIPACIIFFTAYYKTLNADFFECLFVFMFVTSLSCYPFHYALLIDAMTNPQGTYKLFSMQTGLLHLAFLLLIAVIYYFMRKQTNSFVTNLKQIPLKKIFWIVPCFYAILLLLFIPMNYNILYMGRMSYIYPMAITALLISQLTVIYLFYRITRETIYNEELLRKNQLLEFQAGRFENLKEHMQQTKLIRHDFRQQLRTINSLVENENIDELKKFLSEYTENVSSAEWDIFCKNSAVDAIVSYYCSIANSRGIKTDWKFVLPEKLPLSEPIFCGMLGNLIENAIDGCETLSDGEKIIHISAEMPGASIIVLVIENTYDGKIKLDSKGRIISTKHDRSGVGLESAKAITEKYRGNIRIEHDNKSFRVSILLNAI